MLADGAAARSDGYSSQAQGPLQSALQPVGRTPAVSSTAPSRPRGIFADVGGKPCGQALVSEPQTVGGTIGGYTTYKVHGELQDEFGFASFCSRKRYSDFEWLRKTLALYFPGVRIPSLPKKQMQRRFDDAFIESRRSGLEEFLNRCMQRRQIANAAAEVERHILRRFLDAQEDAMDNLKKEFDSNPVQNRCMDFKVAFAKELRALELPVNDTRLEACRTFLAGQLPKLADLALSLRKAVDAHRTAFDAVVGMQEQLAAVCSDESGFLADAQVVEQPRVQLLTGFRNQQDVLEQAPTLQYELLLLGTERELEDAEAMQEAVEALQTLQHSLSDVERKRDALESGSASQGGGTGSWFRATKDNQDSVSKLADLRNEFLHMEEFVSAARTIAIGQEVDQFLYDKVEVHRLTKEEFAKRSRKTATDLESVWRDFEPSAAYLK